MTEHNYDVVVVGGGIGGASLATVMQRAGYSCLVLERTTAFPDRTKGEWIAPWGVVEARRLDLEDVIATARGHVLRRHVFYDETVDPAEAEAASLPLDLIPGVGGPMTQRHPDACQVLLDAAAAAGARVHRGVEEIDISLDPPTVTFSAGNVARQTAGARLLVGADGRNSMVRRRLGFVLDKDPAHHVFSGLLVDGADDWPEDVQMAGAEGDVHFLAFPQGRGRVRLYLGLPLEERHRLAGPDGPAEFARAFHLACVPKSEVLAEASPISPCVTYPNEDAWVDAPVTDGAVLIGDAGGWNDPITGQGLSITLRDVRLVTEILRASSDWSATGLAPYVEERRERLRRLRFAAQIQSALHAEFGEEARSRRRRAAARFAEDPSLSLTLLSGMLGPENVGAECFTEDRRQRILALSP
jgi:2-polyprenyl-6-methoxyphenol hydroxylase-like FAD-dependent oxidoreductase